MVVAKKPATARTGCSSVAADAAELRRAAVEGLAASVWGDPASRTSPATRASCRSGWTGPVAGGSTTSSGSTRTRATRTTASRVDDVRQPDRLATGRLLYVDTYNSAAYGSGWKRENSFLTHRPLGNFSLRLLPHRRLPLPRQRPAASGDGARYRAIMDGPGVSPDVMWSGVGSTTTTRRIRACPARAGHERAAPIG